MDTRIRTVHFIELNLAILFISTSGALGRFIDLPIPITIGLRSLLGGIALYLFCRWKKISFHIEGQDRKTVIIGGVLLGLHWITYFYSLRLSNVAIGMLSLFTYPAITAVLEPIFLKTKILKIHLLLSVLVLVGIYFLVPDFDLQNDDFKAVGFGVLSAFCYATRNIILKTKINQYDGTLLMAYQLLVITLLLSPFAFYLDTSQVVDYLPATLLLALLTTAIGHSLFLRSLKHFSTVTASIVSCSQPVYGIIIGMIFLNEYPEVSTIIGGSIIIFTVLIESLRVFRISKSYPND